NGTEDTTVIYCGDRWCNNAGNGIGYNQWCPITIEGTTCTFNSLSQWSIDAVKGTWEIGPQNNHILNPCFEADRITVSSVIGWEGNDRNAEGSSGAGNFCLSLGSNAKATQRIPENSTIADIPDGTYELKAWIKGNGQISISDFGGSEMKKSSNVGSWTEVSIPGIEISTGKATVSASNTGGGTCTMDEFSLICTDAVSVQSETKPVRRIQYNPATNLIKNYSPGTTFQLELYTVDGKNVLKHKLVSGSGSRQFRLPVHQIRNGHYLMKVVSGENVYYENVNVIR
ncbi:MAG: T9SS type A sorting domain-containing protein, partial [Chitinispirillaceae bacterium]|nr:T9SS type A sorting domain-containing protein [Chitinispirillaceae bacterium]